MENGDPIVRQIVDKLYGPGDEVLESVVIKESEVIVSRETLEELYRAWRRDNEYWGGRYVTHDPAIVTEVEGVLGDGG